MAGMHVRRFSRAPHCPRHRLVVPQRPYTENQTSSVVAVELHIRWRADRGIHAGRIEVVRDVVESRAQPQALAQQRHPPLHMGIELEVRWKAMRVYAANDRPIL